MSLFMMLGLDGPKGLDIRKATRPAHLDWIATLGSRVKLGGPLGSDDGSAPIASVIVIEAKDLAEAQAIFARDPYRQAGLWAQIQIREFTVVAGGFA